MLETPPSPDASADSSSSGSGGSSGSSGSSGGSSGSSGSSSGSVGPQKDTCPSAVSGPQAIFGNCSTRDGRSRVPAPASPHVTWTTKLPTDSSGQVGFSVIATDAAGNVYVATEGQNNTSTAALRRVSGADGSIAWTMPIQPDAETTTPIVLSSGGVDLSESLSASTTQDDAAVFTFNPATGSATSTTFGFDNLDTVSPPFGANIAVGSDGSLYVTHQANPALDDTKTYISRVGPDGTVLWTTPDLSTFGPPLTYQLTVVTFYASTVALAKDDLVVVLWTVTDPSQDYETIALAFDAATGQLKWKTPIQGETTGGPVVRSDGSIVALVQGQSPTSLVILDADTGSLRESLLSEQVWGLFAVTQGGVVLAGANTGYGTEAIADDGSFLWVRTGATARTVASDGTVVAWGSSTIVGLDETSGTTKWELAAPSPSACIQSLALTSNGTLVALQCDGTLFGASD